jgi:hypothetical protein
MPGNDYFTQALLHCDGSSGATTLTDASSSHGSGGSWTLQGGAFQSSANKKFGVTSASFNGTSGSAIDSLGVFASPSSQDFTIDYWLNLNSRTSPSGSGAQLTVGLMNIISCSLSSLTIEGGGVYLAACADSSQFKFYCGSDGTHWDITSSSGQLWGTPSTGVWEHWAVTRQSSIFRLYQNGTLNTTFLSTVSLSTASAGSMSLRIAAQPFSIGDLTNFLGGFVDEIRFTLGIARWTGSAFATPSAPYDEWETEWDVQSLDTIRGKIKILGY